MSRQNYVAIADAIRAEYQPDLPSSEDLWEAGFDAACRAIAQRIAVVMADDNPRFDRGRFLCACGMGAD